MAELNLETPKNVSDEDKLPSRYQTRQRGGKRRQTTIDKMEKRSLRLPMRDIKSDSTEERYKISEDSSDSESSVDENYEVDSLASSIEESLTWRGHMQRALHSTLIHSIIVLLVVTDAIIVIFELLLDVGAFGNLECEGETLFEQKELCHYTHRDSCAPPAKLILEQLNISQSPGSGLGEDGLCTCKFRGGKRVCDDKDDGVGVNPALVLHIASLVILTLFMIEIILKLIAFRLKYFTHKFEVFDGIIVTLSFVLDWASLREEEAFEAASLVIILRLWRVVRIVNGAILSAKSRSDQQLAEARHNARTIIHAFHKAQDRLDATEEENRKLKRQVALGKVVHVKRGNYSAQHTEHEHGNGLIQEHEHGNGSIQEQEYGNGTIQEQEHGNGTIQEQEHGNGSIQEHKHGNGTIQEQEHGNGTIQEQDHGDETVNNQRPDGESGSLPDIEITIPESTDM